MYTHVVSNQQTSTYMYLPSDMNDDDDDNDDDDHCNLGIIIIIEVYDTSVASFSYNEKTSPHPTSFLTILSRDKKTVNSGRLLAGTTILWSNYLERLDTLYPGMIQTLHVYEASFTSVSYYTLCYN